ncbi:metal-dependent membrane protease [Enterococcus quebecensis]|nr:metal-dependent membrane protease [Enterococcus quebecensis]
MYLKEKVKVIRGVIKKSVFLCLIFLVWSLSYVEEIFIENPNFIRNNQTILLTVHIIIACLLLYWIYQKYQKQLQLNNPRNFGFHKFTKNKGLFFIAMVILNQMIDLVYTFLENQEVTNIPENQEILNKMIDIMPISMFFTIVIFAPLGEELIFRGIFFNYFFTKNSKSNNLLVVLVSGLVFGLLHEQNISLNLLVYASAGWILGFIYLYTKDIRYSIAFHFLNNFLSYF